MYIFTRRHVLENEEALRLHSYVDACGKLTIGYGTRILPTDLQVITQPQAEALLDKHVDAILAELWLEIKTLTQDQVDALVIFIYNIGIGGWKTSAARHDLLVGNFGDLPHQLRRWVHDDHGGIVPGLPPRRELEISIFTKGLPHAA